MSNTERQRQFRERNPGYYQRLHAKRRAQARAMLAAARVEAQAQAAVVVRAEPLMLPAPVEVPLIPGLNAIPATLEELHAARAQVSQAEMAQLSRTPEDRA